MKLLIYERRKFNVILLILLAIVVWSLVFFNVSLASSKKTYGDVQAIVVEVHDGDTIKVRVPHWPEVIGEGIGVRVYGVDTRELKTGATAAKDTAQRWIPIGSTVWLRNLRRDKYFRLLADVYFDCGDMERPDTCTSLAAELIEQKLGVPYFGDAKKAFPTDVK